MITSSALGGGGRPAASERISLGFIGAGQRGYANLVRFLREPRVQVVAVCDAHAGRSQRARRRVESRDKGCKVYGDFRELLARDDIDAVCISTPEHWHAIQSIQAARAGKDIYCEKPLSLTIREARAVVRAVRRHGRVFQTGSQERSRPHVRLACELVRNGRIGEVRRVRAQAGGSSRECILPAEPVPAGLNWDLWVGPSPWRPYNHQIFSGMWRVNCRDFGGGLKTDWGSHNFDIVQWGLGTDHTGPVEVIPPDGRDVKTLTFRYANGVILEESASYGVRFIGTEGEIEARGGLATDPGDAKFQEPLGPDTVRLERSSDHRVNFLECVRTRRRPVADVEVGCRSVTLCHLGNIAFWLGRRLTWDPDKEEFVGDAEANRWLDRPKRAPWRLA